MSRHSVACPRTFPVGRIVLAVLVLAAAWLTFRAIQVHGSLQEARSGLTQAVSSARTGDIDALVRGQQDASQKVNTARGAVDDPLWRLAAAIPVAGRSFAVTREATLVVEQVVDEVLPPLLDGGRALKAGDLLTDGRVDLALLGVLEQDVQQAAAAAAVAEAASSKISDRYLPSPIANSRRELLDEVSQLVEGLQTGRQALELAPAMLGADGPRRYFLAVQNNAETRGTGGLVGAYGILRADKGQLALERAGTNLDLKTANAPVVDLGAEFNSRYDRDYARQDWSSAVLTPDWPSAAQIMAGLWRQQGGGKIDGVLGVDPLAMSQILAVTGPAQLSGRRITAKNVVAFVMRDEYVEFANDHEKRKRVLSDLAEALYEQVSAGGYSAPAMLSALGRAGGSGHLQLWSAQPNEQALLRTHRASGALPTEPGSYLHVVSNNAAGNKADYYIRRQVTYVRTSPGLATATVKLTNTIDAQAAPPYATLRVDKPTFQVEPGQTRQLLSVYVGVGQHVRKVFVDGIEASADLGTEQGHGVATVVVEIRPSRPTVITLEVTDPGGVLTYRQQPLVVQDVLDLKVPFVAG